MEIREGWERTVECHRGGAETLQRQTAVPQTECRDRYYGKYCQTTGNHLIGLLNRCQGGRKGRSEGGREGGGGREEGGESEGGGGRVGKGRDIQNKPGRILRSGAVSQTEC